MHALARRFSVVCCLATSSWLRLDFSEYKASTGLVLLLEDFGAFRFPMVATVVLVVVVGVLPKP